MFHLSIADVITAFTTLLPEFIWTVTAPNFYGGNMVCKIVKFLQMIGPYLRYDLDLDGLQFGLEKAMTIAALLLPLAAGVFDLL